MSWWCWGETLYLSMPEEDKGQTQMAFQKPNIYIILYICVCILWLQHLLMLHIPTLCSFIWGGRVFSEGVNIAPFAANPNTPAAHNYTALLSNTWQNPCQVVSVPFDVSQKHCHFHLWHCFQHFGCQCS